MTRAMFCLMHLQWEKALFYNKAVMIVFPILAYYWVQEVLKNIKILLILKKGDAHGIRN